MPLAHKDDFGTLAAGQLPRGEVLERLRPLLEDPAVLKVGHHLKYDQSVLARYGLEVAPYDDTMLLSYAIDGAGHGHGLDELAALHLDHAMMPYEAVCGSGRKQIPFDRVPLEQAATYAAGCADVALRLHGVLKLALAESAAPASTRPSSGRWSRCSRPWSSAASGSTQDPARAVRGLQRAHGRARGRGVPARRAPVQSRLAQAARRDPVRRAGPRERAQDPDRQPRHRRGHPRKPRRTGPRRCPRPSSTGGSCRSSPAPTPTP